MSKKEVVSSKAPGAIGPYSQAVEIGNLVFVSGSLPVNPETNEIEGSDITSQSIQSFENIKAILKELDLEMNNIVKTTVFLQDLNDFVKMNEVYATYFDKPYPARSAFEVAALPKGARVEIEVIAHK